jgi:L-seryl-tRNA(Ser) seleniumtransferase
MTDRGRLRGLPSVDEVLSRPAVRALAERLGRLAARSAARSAIALARARLLAGAQVSQDDPVSDQDVAAAAAREAAPRLRRVINATGVVLHTNLGRAPLHPEAVARVAEIASGYSSLELDLATGKRGHRSAAVAPLLCELFGAPAAHVVNNCAGATLLGLAAVGAGGAAVVSRGELVEIGGGFRVPEIMVQSGCRLVEVGTTNRTRLADYEAALDQLGREGTRSLLLRVHRSNFALLGFTEEPSLSALAGLARRHKVPLLHDLGSGAVASPAAPGLPQEPTPAASLRDGADLVMFSGDKLMGGPQGGILLGTEDLIARVRSHPLSRALRADKMLLAALEATLQLYRQGRAGELPALAALSADEATLAQRATRLGLLLQERGVTASVVECEGRVGGGALPLVRLASRGVALGAHLPERALSALLREGSVAEGVRPPLPPVLTLVRDGRVTLDVRCIPEADLALVADAVAEAVTMAAREPTDAPAGPQPGAQIGSSATLEAGGADLEASEA